MKTFRKRFLSAMCMVAFGVSFAIAQTSTIKHTVDRGETLQSIAKRYATTEAKIIELNPDAAQFVYVGMELVIPVVASQETTKMTIPDDNTLVANHVLPLEQTSSSTANEIDDLSWIQASYLYGFGD